MDASSERTELCAYTTFYRSLIPDSENVFAKKVAEHLRIPIRFLALDDLKPFERWDDAKIAWPEPVEDPFFAGLFDALQMAATDCRVAFDGEGNDALMTFQMWPYTRDLLRRKEWRQLSMDVPRFLRVRRLPWRGVLTHGRKFFGKGPLAPVLPKWISPRLATSAEVEGHWKRAMCGPATQRHPIVPRAYKSLELPHWTRLFETNDPGLTRLPIEVRYPFLDLRIVEYLLATPPFPWLYQKALVRRAMTGRLPAEILIRPKTPLAADPLVAHLQRPETNWIDRMNWTEEMGRYVDRSALIKLAGERSPERARAGIRPHCFNFWLQFARGLRYNLVAEVRNG